MMFMFYQFFFYFFLLSNVAYRCPAIVAFTCLHCHALKLSIKQRAVLPLESDFAGLQRMFLKDCREMFVENILVVCARNIRGKEPFEQKKSFDAEHTCSRKIHFMNQTLGIKGEIADRGNVIQIRIFAAGSLEFF